MIDEISPGLFESRVASFYHACGQYEGFLEHMRQAHAKSGESAGFAIDRALAEARLGEVEEAKRILDEVAEDEVPQLGLPFVDWVRGVIALRTGESDAVAHLRKAVSGLLAMGRAPALWTAQAMCMACYAVALSGTDKERALALMRGAWPIVKVHADEPLLRLIAEKMPEVAQPAV